MSTPDTASAQIAPRAFQSDLLCGESLVSHGFFGRQGGVSGALYASLNCGFGSGDDKTCVAENRRRAAAALGFTGVADIATVHQVHGLAVAVRDAASTWDATTPPVADAIVTTVPGAPIGILTADCVPVLFSGATDQGRPVVGAAHAGWKGALAGVLAATVDTMVANGAVQTSIKAAVGPSITQPSYEVDDRFRDAFLQQDSAFDRFFIDGRPGRHQFDLPAFAHDRLAAAGVSHIDRLGLDTLSEPASFYSYRRSTLTGQGDYGRQISVIGIRPGTAARQEK